MDAPRCRSWPTYTNVRGLQILCHTPSSEKDATKKSKTSKKSARKEKERAPASCSHYLLKHSLSGSCLFVAGESDSQWHMFANWSEWYCWSLTDFAVHFLNLICMYISCDHLLSAYSLSYRCGAMNQCGPEAIDSTVNRNRLCLCICHICFVI